MSTNPADRVDSESEFDQAVIAHLYTTNPDVARWVENTLCGDHILTSILDTEGYTLDPTDAAAVELIATEIELWVIEVGGELPMAPTVDNESETST
ncbi:hypothetical protein ACFQGH_16410 [Halalkalicoccus tibetensis]|uniref:Uncharacterized protein n=2 Tax=Halalkalicoccus tibetensis TaxID=175632 RepID=A0ABD5V7Q8_9EURY